MGNLTSFPSSSANNASAGSIAETAIAENTITMFSKTYCGYCRRAERLFRSEFPDTPLKILQMDEMDDGSAIQRYLAEKTGQRAVPNIFINQKYVGGCDDVMSLHRQGKLAQLLQVKSKA